MHWLIYFPQKKKKYISQIQVSAISLNSRAAIARARDNTGSKALSNYSENYSKLF